MAQAVPMQMKPPPISDNDEGRPRRIGVELEFAGMSLADAAAVVTELFGGSIAWQNPHRAQIDGTCFGRFTAELDSSYVHPATTDGSLKARIEEAFRAAVGDVIEWWMPRELTSPPLPLAQLPEIDRLCAALRERGVLGTGSSARYAFAVQLNPEAPRLDCATVLNTFRAFLLLSDWLHSVVARDPLRAMLAFAEPFPRSYVRRVLDPDYAPDWPQFIDDYLVANPTRNRDLDLTPLFSLIDAERVYRHLDDGRIKARPTYHYRLPDSRIDDPNWSIVSEWNRWVLAEELAADPDSLAERSGRFLTHFIDAPETDWIEDTARWLKR